MNIVPRHVLSELLKVFFMALAGLTLLMLIVGITRQALDEGVGLKHIVQLMPYILPDALRFTIPATILFAVCSVYGRMASNNEIVALKSLGISPLTVLVPSFVLAFFVSWLTFWLNDIAVSWGRDGVRRVVIGAVEDIVLSRLRMRKEYSTRFFSVIVEDVEDKKLIKPTFTFRDKKHGAFVTLRCEHAQFESDGKVLKLKCFNGEGSDGKNWYKFPDTEETIEFDLDQIRDDDTAQWSPSNMALRKILKVLKEQPRKIEAIERELAAKASLQIISGDYTALTSDEWQTDQRVLDHEVYVLHRLRTEPFRRLANGFSCLCFVLVGSSLSMRRRNGNALSSFFLCFLPILIVYYPLLAFGVDQAKSGAMPPWIVWLGNVVLAGWGLWLLRRVMRY